MPTVYQGIIALSSQNTVYCSCMLKNLYPIKLFLTKKPIIISVGLAGLLNLAAWLWIYFGATQRENDAILHYNILFQVDQLGKFSALYEVPALGLGMMIFNTLIAWLLYNRDVFLSELLVAVTGILELGILAATGVLVFLNG